MIRLHHLDHSQSMRVLWLLEELGLPYEIVAYARGKDNRAPEALKAIHPLGKSPVIEDGGRIIAETGAIADYLVERAGGRLGAPADEDSRLRLRYFCHYAQASVLPAVFTGMAFGKVPLVGKALRQGYRPYLDTHLDFLEAELATRTWLVGDEFTLADIMMGFPIELAQATFGDLGTRPRLEAWLARAQDRPAYRVARAKGGDYNLAF
ncbi:glutathione S-transferase family protein [Novosphingobium bradum]|uniref:Glutathione S-transferase family protein n=1 Tax=Novosphingobium bradum TaxID=1737444 RepID=A0ABV7IY16_9SPHN